MTRFLVLLKTSAIAIGFALAAATAQAQAYPERFITLVVATAAGGPGDSAARIIAQRMSALLGQQIVVENLSGGGGTIGTTRVARAAPDGYTLLMHQTGIAIAPALYPKLNVDVETDLTAVGLVNNSDSFLISRDGIPATTLPELVAWMKGPGKPAKFGHPGNGSMGHLTTVVFGKTVGADIDPVPYRGVGPAMNDVLGGHVDLLFAGAFTAAPLIRAGSVKAYMLLGAKRSTALPEIPAAAELGYTDLDIPFWQALFVPAATPRPIIDKLNATLRAALADPIVVAAYEKAGVEAFPPEKLTVEAANAFVQAELKRWRKVVTDNNITAD